MLLVEHLLPSLRQRVVLGAPVVFRRTPFGRDRAVELQTIQSRIERPLLDLEHLVGQKVDGLGDGVAVESSSLERVEDE